MNHHILAQSLIRALLLEHLTPEEIADLTPQELLRLMQPDLDVPPLLHDEYEQTRRRYEARLRATEEAPTTKRPLRPRRRKNNDSSDA